MTFLISDLMSARNDLPQTACLLFCATLLFSSVAIASLVIAIQDGDNACQGMMRYDFI